jgi:hypothetical protein
MIGRYKDDGQHFTEQTICIYMFPIYSVILKVHFNIITIHKT